VAPYLELSLKLIDKSRVKSIFNYSFFTFVIQIGNRLRFGIDNFLIAGFVGMGFVTVYSIAARLIAYFTKFIASAVGVMIPVFSQYEGRDDYNSIRQKFILMTKISSYLSIFVGGALIVFGDAFIERWLGKEYSTAYPLLLILVVPTIFALMQTPSLQLLYGISKHKFHAIVNSIEGVANLILSLILVQKFGLIGVALGTAIPMAITKLFVQPMYTCKVIKLDISKYYLEVIIPIVVKSVSIFIILGWLSKIFIMPNYLNLVILSVSNLIIFSAAVFLMGLNNEERAYFKKIALSSKSIRG
ncbi:MAG: polysaccharide biosynthesis protein, partial [Candidatus Omnitrophica bacterium]|nr:polysaccharide biosynthesis protein [Candidatus Omnitrophota bacterium]